MGSTIHVIAHLRSKEGREDALKSILTALIAPSRREIACYQYDLLQNAADRRDFCFVQRWDTNEALDQHGASEHVARAAEQMSGLLESPPDIRRFTQV